MSALHNHVWLNSFSFLALSASGCLEISSLLKVQPASQIWWIPDFLPEKGLPKSLVHVFWVDYQIIFCLHFSGSLKAEHGSCCPPKLMSSWVWKFSTISLSQGFNLLIHVTHSDFKMKNSKQIWSLCFTNMLIYTEWDVLGKHLFVVTILKVFL